MSSQYFPKSDGKSDGNDKSKGRPDTTGHQDTDGAGGVAKRLDDATSATGRKVEELGETARQKITHAADAVADKAESVGSFLQEHQVSEMANELAGVIRKYPAQSMLVGLGVGFIFGRMTSR